MEGGGHARFIRSARVAVYQRKHLPPVQRQLSGRAARQRERPDVKRLSGGALVRDSSARNVRAERASRSSEPQYCQRTQHATRSAQAPDVKSRASGWLALYSY